MNQHPKSSTHSNVSETKPPAIEGLEQLISHQADALMTDVILKLRVNELVLALRRSPLDREAEVMLSTLESLVIAGEITFPGFMLRVQNLFPQVFDEIEPGLRDQLLAMMRD